MFPRFPIAALALLATDRATFAGVASTSRTNGPVGIYQAAERRAKGRSATARR